MAPRSRPWNAKSGAEEKGSLELCGIVALDDGAPLRIPDAQIISVRHLGALTRKATLAPIAVTPSTIRAYRAVVEAAFAVRTVVPAPFGTVFPDRADLVGWMELHYLTLADTLRRVQDRQVARIRIDRGAATKASDGVDHPERHTDVEVTAFDSFRVLRRGAAGFRSIPQAEQPAADAVNVAAAEAAFLIDRDQWDEFGAAVRDEQRRLPDLHFRQSGPFPPYDFVSLELHG